MKFIRYFKEISINHFTETGYKGSNLGELFKIKIPVPNGFVILTDAFENFLKGANINKEIVLKWKENNFKSQKFTPKTSEIIRKLILKSKIPNEIEKEIFDGFRRLKTKYVAVRSSTAVEDSKINSFAGCFETYLNTTKKNLIENVKKCWSSIFDPKVLFYQWGEIYTKIEFYVAW